MTKFLPTAIRPGLFVGTALALIVLFTSKVQAQVSAYSFAQNNSNSYTAITGGTVLAAATANSTTATGIGGGQVYTVSPAGFSFTFNGIAYTSISVSSNGFVAFGTAPGTAVTLPLSSTTGTTYAGAASAFGRSLNGLFVAGQPANSGELRWELLGAGTTQTLVVQWTNFRPSSTTVVSPVLNFQIRLNESDNSIYFDYNTPTPPATFTASTAQVGLRGASNADFNNRSVVSGTNVWSTSTAGGTNTASGAYNYNAGTPANSLMPGSTLRYSFTPPSGPSTCATKTLPANSATGVCNYGVEFRWSNVPDATGYRIVIDDNSDLSSPLISTNLAGVNNQYYLWNPVSPQPNTTFYWNVIAYNGGGDASGCTSIFSFTTNNTSYTNTAPLSENFEDACSVGNWVISNHTNNQWFVGSATNNGGSNSIYISANQGSTLKPNNSATQNSYFYRDVIIPAGYNLSSFSFDWKNPQTASASDLRVYYGIVTSPTTPALPTGGSTISTSAGNYVQLGGNFKNQATWTNASFNLGSSILGNCQTNRTVRFVFHWNNGTLVAPAIDAAAIDNIVISASAGTSLAGPYTIDPLGSGPSNFTTLTAAINALNSSCVPASGGITFLIPPGTVFNEAGLLPAITVQGTSASKITFQKNGLSTDPNPVINVPGTATADEAAILLSGAAYVTFDGITIANPNAALEYGFYLTNTNALIGGTNNCTIKNCNISLSTSLAGTRAIFMDQTVTATAAAATNQNNKFENNTISACRNGIYLDGGTLFDSGSEITGNTIGADVLDDMGGGSTCYGIYCTENTNPIISGNVVRNMTTNGSVNLIGIRMSMNGGTPLCYNNKIYRLRNSSATSNTSYVAGIVAGTSASVTSDVRVYNNYVASLGYNNTSATVFTDVQVRGLFQENAGAGTVSFDHNTVMVDNFNTPSSQYSNSRSTCVYLNNQTTTVVAVRGNILMNGAPSSSTTGTNSNHYCIFAGAGLGGSGSTWDENAFYLLSELDAGSVRRGFIGDNTGTTAGGEVADLGTWKGTTTRDLNSDYGDPQLGVVGLLGYKANGATINGVVTTFLASWVTDDIEGAGRALPADPGAYEFTPSNVNLAAAQLVSPISTGCYQGNENLVVRIANASVDPVDFSVNPATVTLTINLNSGLLTTRTTTINTGTLSPSGTLDIPLTPVLNMNAPGTYSFITSVTTPADQAPGDDQSQTDLIRVSPTAMPSTLVTFTGFTGTNLSSIFPQWREGTGLNSPAGITSAWAQSTLGTTTTAKISLSGTTDKEWLVGPKVTVGASTEVRFKMAFTTSATGNLATTDGFTGSDNFFEVRYSDDCGATWNTLPGTTINAANWSSVVGNSPNLVQLNYTPAALVPALSGKEVIFALYASEGTTSDAITTTAIHVDDLSVRNKPTQDLEIIDVASPKALTCGGLNIPMQVTVRSTGSGSYDFTTNPASFNVQIVDPSSSTINIGGTVNTGTPLASGTTRVLTINTFNMITLGTYTFTPTITAEAAGADASNNTGAPETKVIYPQGGGLPVDQPFGVASLSGNWREGDGKNQPLGTTADWSFNSSSANYGSGYASMSLSGSGVTDWVVSPITSIPASGNYELRFRFGFTTLSGMTSSNGDDAFKVRISTDCGGTWTDLFSVTSANAASVASEGFTPKVISLNAYRGQDIQIGFYGDNGVVSSDLYSIILDDVKIMASPSNDLQAVGYVQPTVGCYSANQTMVVQVRNSGLSPINFASTPASITINVTNAVVASLTGTISTGTLAAGATQNVALTPTFNMSATGTYVFNGSVTFTDDDVSNNAFPRGSFAVQSQYTGTASGATQFLDWTGKATGQITSSTAMSTRYAGWGIGFGDHTAGMPGTSIFGMFVEDGEGGNRLLEFQTGGTPSTSSYKDWLISSKFAATAGAELRFKLGTAAYNSPDAPNSTVGFQDDDYVAVVVSTDCGNTWTERYRISNTSNGGSTLSHTLTSYSVPLSTYAGQNIFIGIIVHAGTVNTVTTPLDLYDVILDDVQLRNAPAVDLGVSALVTPAERGCYSGAQTLRTRVQNTGTATRNFGTTTASIRVTVTAPGGGSTIHNGTYNTGTVAPDGFAEVNLTPTLTMSAAGTYTFFVQLLTADGDASNNSYSYTRTKNAVVAGFQQLDFEAPYNGNPGAVYPGWSEGAGIGFPIGTSSIWSLDDFANIAGGSKGASMEFGGISDAEWMVSPPIVATATTQLSFDLALTGNDVTTAPTERVAGNGAISGDDQFIVYISTDCGNSWTPLPGQSYTGGIGGSIEAIPNTGTNVNIDLSSYIGQTIRIAFYGAEGPTGLTTDFNNYEIHLDNVQLGNRFANDMELSAVMSPYSGVYCESGNLVKAKVFNAGTSPASFKVRATPVGNGGSFVEVTYPGTLASLAFATVDLGSMNLPYGTTSINLEVIQTGDQDLTNNTRSFALTQYNANAAAPSVTPANTCINTPATLVAGGGGSFAWYASMSSTTKLSSNDTLITPNLPGTTTYYVSRMATNTYHVANNPTPPTSTSSNANSGVQFNTTGYVTIKSVYVYPNVANATVSISIKDKYGVVFAGPIVRTLTNGVGVKTLFDLDVTLPPSDNWAIVQNTTVALGINSGSSSGVNYPSYVTPDGRLNIHHWYINGAQSTLQSAFYYFYDWIVETGGVCPSVRVPVTATVQPTGTWTGAASVDWSNASNWCGGVPTSTVDVVVPGTGTQPQIITGTQNARNLTLQSGATLQSNGTLNVAGDLTANVQIGGNGTINMNGTTPQTITGAIRTANLTISNSSLAGVSLAPGTSVRLQPVNNNSGHLNLAPGSKFTSTGGNVILASNAQGTASLGAMTGGSTFTGTLTQERFISQGTSGWYFAGAPFSDATLNQWSEASPRVAPLNNATIFWYQESDSSRTMANGAIAERYGWRVPTSLSGQVNPNGNDTRGYRVWLRPGFFSSGGVISHSGTPFQGPKAVDVTRTPGQYDGGGWNLIANPYPSDINWNSVVAPASMNDATYIWNRADNQYQVYVKGTGTTLGVAVNATANPNLIPSSASFFVKTTATSTINFAETAKSATSHEAYRTGSSDNLLRALLVRESPMQKDEIAIRFIDGATTGFDLRYDGGKLFGSDISLSSTGGDGSSMAINSLPELTATTEIPLNVTAPQGAYHFQFSELSSFATGTGLWLRDRLTGTLWPLDETQSGYSFTVTADPATSGGQRFALVVQPASATGLIPMGKQPALSIWPNPASGGMVNVALYNLKGSKASLTVIDALGHVVHTADVDLSNSGATVKLNTAKLANGIYTVRIASETSVLTRSLDIVR